MNILDAIKDENLFRPFLADKNDSIASWGNWRAACAALYGLPIPGKREECVAQCSNRGVSQLPNAGFDVALFLTGRRSGKSRMAAVIGAYEAVLAGHESKLSTGELGIVAVISPTKKQSRIVKDYLRAIFNVPMLHREVVGETKEGFELSTGTVIEILTGDWRTLRGYTLLAAIIDEAAFFGYDADAKVKSDAELIRAIKPSLATVRGKLIGITTPYARKGWCWTTFQKNFGNNAGKVLVWNCPSRTMNPRLPQSVVDDALEEDLAAAKSEYLGEFRDDVGAFLPRSVIEKLVVEGRTEIPPHWISSTMRGTTRYVAFADLSGGRADDAALAIAHREKRMVIVDFVKRWKPPFNPHFVVGQMCDEMKRYGIKRVTGDNYAAEFVAGAFQSYGIAYTKAELPKSALYLELLPRLCAAEIELPDDDLLVTQLANLERRTRSGGKDIIDHPPGGHDDLANAVAGVAVAVSANQLILGPV